MAFPGNAALRLSLYGQGREDTGLSLDLPCCSLTPVLASCAVYGGSGEWFISICCAEIFYIAVQDSNLVVSAA